MSNQITNFRVAIVDGEPIVADTLAAILNLHGYEAKAHYCGESALADAKLSCPQVVLSEVGTRNIDGIEMALRIREGNPECRIILFTASPIRREIYSRIQDLGFEFLQRPLHPREVLDRGTEYCGNRESHEY